MKFFSKLATSALTGLAVLGFASSAFAQGPKIQEGSIAAHSVLVEAIERAGVKVIINDPFCDESWTGLMGFYAGKERTLVVCQDNRVDGDPTPVAWTDNDLDTLRHEAQHFIQDCMVGTNHDHLLHPVYRFPVAYAESVLGEDALRQIAEIYRANGASEQTVILEFEAFAVAANNVPLEQVNDIARYCR